MNAPEPHTADLTTQPPAPPAAPPVARAASELAGEIAAEQRHLDLVYGRLDAARDEAASSLRGAVSTGSTGTPSARSEREAFITLYRQRVAQLAGVEDRLCFGRLDLSGESDPTDSAETARARYIGRVGLSDAERAELLIDWRAPAAEPFYRATAAQPDGVVRRRSISTARRRVTALSDEVLDVAAFGEHGVGGSHLVAGEGALFASLDAARTGHMSDIVATIQSDQDRAVRAPLAGVLVVQGGPGTGKTAVALHRTAYLLYAHRQHIDRTGVLLVGPNRAFLRYIDQVLPNLGEAESVVMRTPGELVADVRATEDDAPAVVAVKGDLRMATVIAQAVKRRQRTLSRSRRIRLGRIEISLKPSVVVAAREHARRSRRPHNEAREDFAREVLRDLVRQLAAARGVDPDDEGRADLLAELRESPDVRREVNWCWAPINPARLLRDLYADEQRRAEATAGLSPPERALLQRARNAPWTLSDVALLDEAAELLGPDPTLAGFLARPGSSALAGDPDDADDPFSTSAIEARLGVGATSLAPVAERAAGDRQWAYGHVVVDEAQELSPMMWRLLMRRCPSKSMTVVGDIAQTSSAAGASSWAEVLTPHVGTRWSERTLTVNYRTPGQIMAVADKVARAAGSTVAPPRSARQTRWPVQYEALGAQMAGLGELVASVRPEAGTLGVLVAGPALAAAQAAMAASAAGNGAVDAAVTVSTVAAAKGLEFDVVVVVEPAEMIESSPRGRNDLYVALTRATQRLVVAHHRPLPAELR